MAIATIASWTVPDGHVAVVTTVHQALESPQAYRDCTFLLWYRGQECEYWKPEKAEVTPTCIVLFEEETIELRVLNEGLLRHYCDAEITGYYYRQHPVGKNQIGASPHIGLNARGENDV